MIGNDKNRKTFRSKVKKRNGGRLPGMEMYLQGHSVKDANIARGVLPIISRGGQAFRHDYEEAQAVYTTVPDDQNVGLEKLITVQVDVDDGSASFISGQADFTNLVGQTFRIYNPAYVSNNALTEYWEFIFTSTLGVDPRLVYIPDGLYPNYRARVGDTFNIAMKNHMLKPYPRPVEIRKFEDRYSSELEEYGKLDPNTGQYMIPLGFSLDPFPQEIPLAEQSNTYIDPANFDMKEPLVYESLARNPYWLYAVITRALYTVLPKETFRILDPENITIPTLSKAAGSIELWDSYQFPYTGNVAPLSIKIQYY